MPPTRAHIRGTVVTGERAKGNVGVLLQRAVLRPGRQIQNCFGGMRAVRGVVICRICTLLTRTWVISVEGTRAVLPGPQLSIDHVCTACQITRHPDDGHLRSIYLQQWALHLLRSWVGLQKHIYSLLLEISLKIFCCFLCIKVSIFDLFMHSVLERKFCAINWEHRRQHRRRVHCEFLLKY